jgi:hypothetical protein
VTKYDSVLIIGLLVLVLSHVSTGANAKIFYAVVSVFIIAAFYFALALDWWRRK